MSAKAFDALFSKQETKRRDAEGFNRAKQEQEDKPPKPKKDRKTRELERLISYCNIHSFLLAS